MIECKFENGNNASLRHVTVGAIAVKNQQILLVKRATSLTNPGKFALPGGFLDRNETTEQGVLRELLEETGYTGKVIKLLRFNDNPNRKGEDRQNVDCIYVIEVGEKLGESDQESSEVTWFDFDKLPAENDWAFDHFETTKIYLSSLK